MTRTPVRPPLRLLYLLEDTDQGGWADHVTSIARRLARMQTTMAVCSISPHGCGTARIQAGNVPVVSLELPETRGLRGLVTEVLAVMRVRTLLGKYNPQILHALGPRAAVVARLAAAGMKSTRIVTMTGQGSRGFRRLLDQWSRVVRRSDAVLALDTQVGEGMGTIAAGVGVDISEVRSAMPVDDALLPSGPFYVGLPVEDGRTDNIRDMLDAFRMFASHRADARLVIFSRPEAACVRPWDMGIEGRVIHLDLPGEDSALMKRMNVLWMHGSPWPQTSTILKAMCAGVPVVCDDTTPLAGHIREIGGALMCDGGWPRQFAEATRELSEDGKLSDAVALAGQEVVKRYHPFDLWSESLRDFYQEMQQDVSAVRSPEMEGGGQWTMPISWQEMDRKKGG